MLKETRLKCIIDESNCSLYAFVLVIYLGPFLQILNDVAFRKSLRAHVTRDELSGPPFPGPRTPLLVDQRVGVVPDAAQLVGGSLLQLSTVEQLYVVEH